MENIMYWPAFELRFPALPKSRTLGAWALILLLFILPFQTGCSGTQVAQNIVNWMPSLQAAVTTVDSTASLLAPQYAPIFTAATIGFDAAATLVVAQAKAYLANPSSSVLAQLQSAVLAFQSSVSASVLAAAKITNSASQAKALNAINGVSTIITAIIALLTTIKGATVTPASVTATKLSEIRPYLDEKQSVAIVANHYGITTEEAQVDYSVGMARLQAVGF